MGTEQAPRRFPFGQAETLYDGGNGPTPYPPQYGPPPQWAGGARQPGQNGTGGFDRSQWTGSALSDRGDSRSANLGSLRRGDPKHLRTDPTLYEWDRLTPDQQQSVMAAISGKRLSTPGRFLRTALVYALAIVALVGLFAAYLAFGR